MPEKCDFFFHINSSSAPTGSSGTDELKNPSALLADAEEAVTRAPTAAEPDEVEATPASVLPEATDIAVAKTARPDGAEGDDGVLTLAVGADLLWGRIQALLGENNPEPVKLTKLKAQLKRAGQDKLFLCLIADIPCDNNRAERDLRGLVLKRKRSFGSKTEQGAQALATVLSICTTTWRMHPSGYFRVLAAI